MAGGTTAVPLLGARWQHCRPPSHGTWRAQNQPIPLRTTSHRPARVIIGSNGHRPRSAPNSIGVIPDKPFLAANSIGVIPDKPRFDSYSGGFPRGMTIDSGKPTFNHYHYSHSYACAYCHCYSYPSSSFYSYSYCYFTGATFAPSATLGIITTRRRCSAIGMRRIRFWQMSALAFGVTN